MSVCELYPDIKMTVDHPNGFHRFTYVMKAYGVIKSYAILIIAEPLNGKPCLSIGYASPQKFQGCGLASEIIEQSIKEIKNGLKARNINEFYIEAVIGIENIASQRIAEKILSNKRKQIIDELSGEDAYYYKKLVS